MEANKAHNKPENQQTQTFTFAYPPDELTLESGEKLGPITLAYETYGKLNAEKSNAILVLHALSGDAHAAGTDGWWSNLIGAGKGIDTDKYFVICSNVIGGCKGSTGPSSINPKTGKPYGIDFPLITIGDMVNAQRHLIDHLGIEKLLISRRRLHGRHASAAMDGFLSQTNTLSNSHCNHTEAYTSANRLQRSWATSNHGRPRLEKRQLLRLQYPQPKA